MALNDDIRLLSQLPLFKDMNEDQLRLIAFGADRRMSPGQTLFREGSPAESAYVVAQRQPGTDATSSDGMQGQRRMPVRHPASELALVTLVERKFTAVAREDTDIIRITRALFHRLIEEYPDAARLIENRVRDNLARACGKGRYDSPASTDRLLAFGSLRFTKLYRLEQDDVGPLGLKSTPFLLRSVEQMPSAGR